MSISMSLFKAFTRVHIFFFRKTGGRIGGKMFGAPVLLLTTTGRKTGLRRTVPLLSDTDGEDFIIVASMGGAPQHPAWYNNLVANSSVEVEVRGRAVAATARTATSEERPRLWAKMVARYRGYEGYQKKTQREIPIVILTPAAS